LSLSSRATGMSSLTSMLMGADTVSPSSSVAVTLKASGMVSSGSPKNNSLVWSSGP
jgi:hypothetical protein